MRRKGGRNRGGQLRQLGLGGACCRHGEGSAVVGVDAWRVLLVRDGRLGTRRASSEDEDADGVPTDERTQATGRDEDAGSWRGEVGGGTTNIKGKGMTGLLRRYRDDSYKWSGGQASQGRGRWRVVKEDEARWGAVAGFGLCACASVQRQADGGSP